MALGNATLKQHRYKREAPGAGWAVAPGATGAQILRRVTAMPQLRKQTYISNEIRRSLQRADMRHGVKSVEHAYAGELSPGTFQDFWRASARQAFQAAATTGAITTVTAAATPPHFSRSAGDFIANGFKMGDVVRWAGFAGGSAPQNNAKNFLITTLTTTQMSGIFLDGSAVVADAAGDSVTCTVVGKKTWVPLTGHLDDSFAFEDWYPDLNQSELYLGCKLQQTDVGLSPQGMATIGMQFMGRDMTPAGVEYYTTPTAETVSGLLAAVNGAIIVNGLQVALLTNLQFSLIQALFMEPVAGSNLYPGILPTDVVASGQFTAFFDGATLRDLFLNETEISIIGAFTTSNVAAADLLAFVFPRVKLGSADKDDGKKAEVRTYTFESLENVSGGAAVNSLPTTFSIQDSLAA